MLRDPIDIDKLSTEEMIDLCAKYNDLCADPEEEKSQARLAIQTIRLSYQIAVKEADYLKCTEVRKCLSILLFEVERRKKNIDTITDKLPVLDFSKELPLS